MRVYREAAKPYDKPIWTLTETINLLKAIFEDDDYPAIARRQALNFAETPPSQRDEGWQLNVQMFLSTLKH
jgi:hypothetical protein